MIDFRRSLDWLRPAYHTTYVWICIAIAMLGAIGQGERWAHNEVFVYDMGGYYVYLPSAFLSHDLGDLSWTRGARANYRPDQNPDYGNVLLPTGKVVFKYPMGMAIAYAPWFGLTTGIYYLKGQAATTGYEYMYQYILSLGCMLYVLLGLALLGRELRHFFADHIAALTLLILAFGTNLFTYAAYEPLMSHGTLFMLNVLLLRYTRRWYAEGTARAAAALGLTSGLLVLVRPSEVLLLLLPVLWGLTSLAALPERLRFWAQRWPQTLLVIGLAALVAGLQLVFWRVVGGQWLAPFYPGESFDFSKPHVWDGLFSVRKGWLFYSPLLVLALLGIAWLRRSPARSVLPALLVVLPIVIYVTFCWWDWGYGGSYGGRTMISLYPMLSFGLAAFWQRWLGTGKASYLWVPLVATLLVVSLIQNHQYYIGMIHWAEETWVIYQKYFLLLKWPPS
ncbi:hypothetical protein [Hymenobacter persicinus]|uniref:Glycosyltransferase RgtA/B/C/D-like domain-containing protein n=1 Tax=Hymenobacter persicinus TaxID=2025506 RepID=A0A4Q5LBH4_9BACT|nr:hypothetical protein [Hymenobacter persicinus]RYU78427.1 hypothetical protein EWM57_14120 [Hymenobacter persicinus]